MNKKVLAALYDSIEERLDQRFLRFKDDLLTDVVGTSYSFPKYLYAELPTVSQFMVAFVSDGRKLGELSGEGTGVPVYYDNASGFWLTFSDNTEVSI